MLVTREIEVIQTVCRQSVLCPRPRTLRSCVSGLTNYLHIYSKDYANFYTAFVVTFEEDAMTTWRPEH